DQLGRVPAPGAGDIGPLGGVADGRADPVQAVEPPLDAGRAAAARHPADDQFQQVSGAGRDLAHGADRLESPMFMFIGMFMFMGWLWPGRECPVVTGPRWAPAAWAAMNTRTSRIMKPHSFAAGLASMPSPPPRVAGKVCHPFRPVGYEAARLGQTGPAVQPGLARLGPVRRARFGAARLGPARPGAARSGAARITAMPPMGNAHTPHPYCRYPCRVLSVPAMGFSQAAGRLIRPGNSVRTLVRPTPRQIISPYAASAGGRVEAPDDEL